MKEVYVITGATGGIGSDLAKKITKNVLVLLVDLDKDKLNDLKKELHKKKIESEFFVGDISIEDDIIALVEKVKSLGNFKVLVHAAGISQSMGNAEDILRINLIGTKLLMDHFYNIADNSVVVNIASISGHMIPDLKMYNDILLDPLNPNFIDKMRLYLKNDSSKAYALSKKGIMMLVEKEVGKWAKKKSRVVSVSPGAIETSMSLYESKENPAVDFLIKNTPIPRFGKPEEVTDLVLYLCSDKAKFITGVDIVIDGGIVSHLKYNDIFGIAEDKVPKLIPFVLYVLVFLLLPFFISKIVDLPVFLSFKNLALVIYFPVTVLFITLFSTRNKMSLYLIILPVLIFLITCLIYYDIVALLCCVMYALIAFVTNFIVQDYAKK